MWQFPPGMRLPKPDRYLRHGGCLQRSLSLMLWKDGFQPQLLLGKFWHFFREAGPPFRHKGGVTRGVFHVWATWFDNSRDALRDHGIRMYYCQGMGFNASWDIAWNRLQRGRATPVLVDLFHIPMTETFYQKEKRMHVSPLVGHDPADGRTFLMNTVKEIEPIEVDFATFQRAWEGEECEWYDLDIPAQLPGYSTDDVQRAVLENLELMLRPHPGERWWKGVPAMRRLADDIAAIPDRYDHALFPEILADGFAQIPNIREQRFIHANFLRLVAEQLHHEPLQAHADDLYSIGKAWQEFRQWFVRVEEMAPREGFGLIAEKLRALADLEEAGLSKLEELVTAPTWPQHVPINLRALHPGLDQSVLRATSTSLGASSS